MAHQVTIRQANCAVTVEDGESILESALRAGIDYPFGCRGGVCGSCKSALVTGQVDLRGHQEFALSAQEQLQGMVLACCSYPRGDCEVAWVDADEPVDFAYRELGGTVVSIEKATHDIAIVKVGLDNLEMLEFAAGQYASVRFNDLPARCYSFANRPGEAVLEFHVRAVPNGQVSQAVYNGLQVGDTVQICGPQGVAYLRQHHSGSAIFCAGGSGLAPILSMLRVLAHQRSERRLRLYFGVRGERDLYAQNELRSLVGALPNAEVTVVLSDPHGPTAHRTGFLADVMRTDLDDCGGSKSYLCGPPVMIETCRAVLLEKGVSPANCHVDVFWTAPAVPIEAMA